MCYRSLYARYKVTIAIIDTPNYPDEMSNLECQLWYSSCVIFPSSRHWMSIFKLSNCFSIADLLLASLLLFDSCPVLFESWLPLKLLPPKALPNPAAFTFGPLVLSRALLAAGSKPLLAMPPSPDCFEMISGFTPCGLPSGGLSTKHLIISPAVNA